MLQNDKIRVLIPEDEIFRRIKTLAGELNKFYRDDEVLMVCILKGAFIFMADLIRELRFPVTTDFMVVSSYGNSTETSGEIRIIKDLQTRISGRKILVVEDIIDTGLTLDYLLRYLKSREPSDIRVCTFLNKPSARRVPISIDFCAFEIGNEFVIGYGLDYAQNYRQLPFVGVLTESV